MSIVISCRLADTDDARGLSARLRPPPESASAADARARLAACSASFIVVKLSAICCVIRLVVTARSSVGVAIAHLVLPALRVARHRQRARRVGRPADACRTRTLPPAHRAARGRDRDGERSVTIASACSELCSASRSERPLGDERRATPVVAAAAGGVVVVGGGGGGGARRRRRRRRLLRRRRFVSGGGYLRSAGGGASAAAMRARLLVREDRHRAASGTSEAPTSRRPSVGVRPVDAPGEPLRPPRRRGAAPARAARHSSIYLEAFTIVLFIHVESTPTPNSRIGRKGAYSRHRSLLSER